MTGLRVTPLHRRIRRAGLFFIFLVVLAAIFGGTPVRWSVLWFFASVACFVELVAWIQEHRSHERRKEWRRDRERELWSKLRSTKDDHEGARSDPINA